ncbi:protein phosphatase 2C domain-containing protein [Gloeobacter morelensis]|uniref:Protein phosphatase 2C domain-containing protein n=1 Tax=Gloeobacter morelensis MG652769 TaxID=2781736 RepID=A0ABY3PPN2_9CYAN|nr:protein phosphatase 2C domain-containing protein [Gloeobacter morelensis]UFP95569.1 protein phosphatase 2C domain-containing protein [Gloeobacter morelensis MG652769]
MHYLVTGNRQALDRRYQVVGQSPAIVRDLLPDQPTAAPAGLPAGCRPYQRLHHFRWAIPEIHTCMAAANGGEPCVLLARGPLAADGTPWPTLRQGWATAAPLQQIGWLVQLARLWEPCVQEGVASSLLAPDNIGVLGWQACLFYLSGDLAPPPLAALGQSWQGLAPLSPPLAAIVGALCLGRIARIEELSAALENLAAANPSRGPAGVLGATHPGSRKANEDCFIHGPLGTYGIVCDGMGGHEGGAVASRMALDLLDRELQQLSGQTQPLPPLQVRRGMALALYRANQLLLETNRRQGRQRQRQMGTTVVAYCLSASLLHIAHVGDSRIYLIDRHHCQQLTVDDDVANQEVSLARTTSAAMLRMDGSGHLTQALGVIAMESLQPTVQTFVLPEDCLVLLCSDGLCDGALIERCWQTVLLPMLTGDLATGAGQLIDLALQELGHDNITFILLKYAA